MAYEADTAEDAKFGVGQDKQDLPVDAPSGATKQGEYGAEGPPRLLRRDKAPKLERERQSEAARYLAQRAVTLGTTAEVLDIAIAPMIRGRTWGNRTPSAVYCDPARGGALSRLFSA